MKSLLVLAALAALAAAPARGAEPAAPMPSQVFPWNPEAAVPSKTGSRRTLFNQPTATMNLFHCHVSVLNPGQNTGAPHRHPQEELVIIKEGTLRVNIDGKLQTATAGAMIFYAANENENMTNIGATPATYYVLQVFTDRTPKG
ncbi:MAG TPA: cupin domain-containing protein [Opitutaceae bacterium]|nr:cupin domain-containing protein [Opitutaceae bacterium]